jgi:hypothetical protein
MKTTKLLPVALIVTALAASTAFAQGGMRTTRTNARPSMARSRTVAPRTYARPSIAGSRTAARGSWNHNHYRHSHSNVYFNFGLGYPYYGYGYGDPYYYGSYPYGYGYYAPVYPAYTNRGITDDATVAAVQRRLAHGGYYHGSIDGVIGPGTRTAIRAFENNNGLPVDGVIDHDLLRTMGLS